MPFPTDDAIPDESYKMWICGSLNKNQVKMNDVLNAINPTTIAKVAGAGNKIVYLLD